METVSIAYDSLIELHNTEKERQGAYFDETMRNVSSFQESEAMQVLRDYATCSQQPYPTYSHA